MVMFKRNKSGNDDKRRIYEPEKDYSAEFPHSGWRKPLDVNHVNPKAKRSLLSMEFGFLKFIDILNIFLCVLILLGIVKLVFSTTYEQTVLVDGTELSCLVLEDGSIVPYQPPVAPSVPMPKQPLIQDKPMVALYTQSRAAELGNNPAPQAVNPSSGVVAVVPPSNSMTPPPANTMQMTPQTSVPETTTTPPPAVSSLATPGIASSSTGISSNSTPVAPPATTGTGLTN